MSTLIAVTAALSGVPEKTATNVVNSYYKSLLISMVANGSVVTPIGTLEYQDGKVVVTSISPLVESLLKTDLTLDRVVDIVEASILNTDES